MPLAPGTGGRLDSRPPVLSWYLAVRLDRPLGRAYNDATFPRLRKDEP
jgi:hypothetical protein